MDKLLAEAQNESTSEVRLAYIWFNTKSIKVRKAIAGNPNAGPKVLRMAARLYLEEVLSNPNFEMLMLFDEDEWVRSLAMAYSDPTEFVLKTRHYYRSTSKQTDSLYRACLLSEKLSADVLDRIVGNMSLAALKRALKNQEVRKRIVRLIKEQMIQRSYWPLNLETIIILYGEEVISDELMIEVLGKYGTASSSASKRVFCKYVQNLHKRYEESGSATVAILLGKTYFSVRAHCVSWVVWSMNKPSKRIASLYARVMNYLIRNGKRSSLLAENVRNIGVLICSFIKAEFFDYDGHSNTGQALSLNLESVYRFLSEHGLETEEWGKIGLQLQGKNTLEELEKTTEETQEFYIKAKVLGTWASVVTSDAKYSVINKINERIYSEHGICDRLLFNKCSMRKIISLDDQTHIF